MVDPDAKVELRGVGRRNAFKDYQAGIRVGTQAAMAEAVRGLSEADLADLAYYLARFRP